MKKSIYTSYDELPSLRIGKRIVVPKEELRKWIAAHTKGASGC